MNGQLWVELITMYNQLNNKDKMKAKLIKDGNLYGLKDGDKIIGTSDDELNSLLNYPFRLSIKNCQSIERGYDLDELAKNLYKESLNYHLQNESDYTFGVIDGFQKALELMGDKKFSEEDVLKAIEMYYKKKKIFIEIIQSLQQTEWDVDMCTYVDTQGYDIPDADSFNHGNIFTDTCVPKLDADGCLILKLKSE